MLVLAFRHALIGSKMKGEKVCVIAPVWSPPICGHSPLQTEEQEMSSLGDGGDKVTAYPSTLTSLLK